MTRSVFNHRRQPPSQTLLSADSFNRANNASLGNTDGAGTKDPLTWTNQSGTFAIDTNRAKCTGTGVASRGMTTTDVTVADIDITMTIAVASTSNVFGMLFRFSSTSAYLLFYTNNVGNYAMGKVTTGLGTVNALSGFSSTGTVASANGDVIRLVAKGSSISAYINGTLWATASDSFNSTATKHGLASEDTTTGRFDAWSVYTAP